MNTFSKYQWYRTMGGIGFAAAVIAGCASVPPPTEQMAISKEAVSTANSVGGSELAPADMRAARDKMDRATQAMTAKDYKNAQWLAEQAQADAEVAAAKARSAKAQKAAVIVQEDSQVLRTEIDRKSQ